MFATSKKDPPSPSNIHSESKPKSNNNTKEVAGENDSVSSKIQQQQPPDPPFLIPKALSIGTLAGICGSLAGMGGGFVMIPFMTSTSRYWGLSLSQHQAHGTSLFAVAATGVAGALGYEGHAQYEAAAAIAAGGIITARLGASATTQLSEKVLKKYLGIFMICVAPLVPLKGYLLSQQPTPDDDDTNVSEKDDEISKPTKSWQERLIPPAMIGLGSGFLAGLFGVGGGAVVVPALTLFTDVNHYQALGTSLCAMAFPAISGTITHFKKGNVAMRVAPFLAAGAFCGGYLGGKLGLHTNENALRWGFSGLMVTLGARTFLRA